MQFVTPDKDPGVFEIDVLSNGIHVYHRKVEQVFGLPKISGSVLVQVGGRDDPRGKEGSAHFFEHMPFRGTEKYPSLYDLTYPIESNGGYINAFTTDEATGYEVTLPYGMLADGVARLADMLIVPLMREADIEIERKVILEELKNKLANVNFFARQELFKHLLGEHPIVHAVIGTEEALLSVKKDDLTGFHNTYYNAENISLFFGGEYDRVELIKLCEQYFGKIPLGKKTERDVQAVTSELPQSKIELEPKQYNRSVYILGRKMPSTPLEENVKIKLFMDMLARGMNSPLNQEIREKRGMAYNLGITHYHYQDVGLLVYTVSTSFHQMDEVDNIIWEQNASILENQSRFDEVKHMLKQGLLHRDFGVPGVVDSAMDSYIDRGRIVTLEEYLQLVEKTTLADVRDYMSQLLNKEHFLNVRVNCDR